LKKKSHKKKATGVCALMLQFGVFTYETNAQAEKGEDVEIHPPVAGVPPTELDASSGEDTGSASAEETASGSAEETGSASAEDTASASGEDMTIAEAKAYIDANDGVFVMEDMAKKYIGQQKKAKKAKKAKKKYKDNASNRSKKRVGLTKDEYDAGVRTD
jgi:hypothetical protein